MQGDVLDALASGATTALMAVVASIPGIVRRAVKRHDDRIMAPLTELTTAVRRNTEGLTRVDDRLTETNDRLAGMEGALSVVLDRALQRRAADLRRARD